MPSGWFLTPPSLSVGTGGCFLRSEASANVKLTSNMRLVPRYMIYLLRFARTPGKCREAESSEVKSLK
jgi:hypothetical protein